MHKGLHQIVDESKARRSKGEDHASASVRSAAGQLASSPVQHLETEEYDRVRTPSRPSNSVDACMLGFRSAPSSVSRLSPAERIYSSPSYTRQLYGNSATRSEATRRPIP